jgi:hypothetical protein
MRTQCNAEQLQFSSVERRQVVAGFEGGTVSSDAGALLLGRTDEAIGLIDRLAESFCGRAPRDDDPLAPGGLETFLAPEVSTRPTFDSSTITGSDPPDVK